MAHSIDQKPPIIAKIENKKEEKVCFKATLLKKDSSCTDLYLLDEIEARRFVVPNDCRKSLLYLKAKIHFLFKKPRSRFDNDDRKKFTHVGDFGVPEQNHFEEGTNAG